jgi:hypothetical protein
MNTVRCPSCDGLFTLSAWNRWHRRNCWFTRLQAEGAAELLREMDSDEARLQESLRELRGRIAASRSAELVNA